MSAEFPLLLVGACGASTSLPLGKISACTQELCSALDPAGDSNRPLGPFVVSPRSSKLHGYSPAPVYTTYLAVYFP